MAFTEVKLIGLTRGQELHEAYILIFEVQETQRIVPIFVDREEFEMVECARPYAFCASSISRNASSFAVYSESPLMRRSQVRFKSSRYSFWYNI